MPPVMSSVYNARGFFEPNDQNRYPSTASPASRARTDGSPPGLDPNGSADPPNTISTPEGWNYLVRLYRPRPEILDGTWQLPGLAPATD